MRRVISLHCRSPELPLRNRLHLLDVPASANESSRGRRGAIARPILNAQMNAVPSGSASGSSGRNAPSAADDIDMAELHSVIFRHALLISSIPEGYLPILLLAHLLHPIDRLAVELLLNGNVRHRGCGGCAVPVLFAGGEPDDIAGPNLLDWPAVALCPAAAGRHDQRLAERVRVPGRAGAGSKVTLAPLTRRDRIDRRADRSEPCR